MVVYSILQLTLYTGKTSKLRHPSPPSDELDDALIHEYLAELEEPANKRTPQKVAHVATSIIDVDTEDPGDLEREFTAGKSAGFLSLCFAVIIVFYMGHWLT